jgi:hypothetical protein
VGLLASISLKLRLLQFANHYQLPTLYCIYPMINWYNLFANSLWILALSLLLAILSYTRWEAKRDGKRLRDRINQPERSLPMNLAGALFCLGLAATSQRWWEIGLWLLLFILFVVQGWGLWKMRRET